MEISDFYRIFYLSSKLHGVTSHKAIIFMAVVPKVCPMDAMGSTDSSKGIHGYISVMAALKLTDFTN
jgi:hypothetical protein